MKKILYMLMATGLLTLGSCETPAEEREDIAEERAEGDVEDVAEERQELREE